MATVAGLQCVRCGALYPPVGTEYDCVKCRPVVRSNLTVAYDDALRVRRPRPGADAPAGLWRYGELLPVRRAEAVTLAEGGTPLHSLGELAAELGIGQLLVKDESRNPTGSFKDRLACLAVSAARKQGAGMLASSSSGNAGAAVAAYAAKARIPCVVFTFNAAAGPMIAQMRAYGAMVLSVADRADRWKLLEAGVREHGWFPTSPFFGPAVGSNPYGIEGYKTLAYEIAEGMDWDVPDWCVLPVCYGDALLGMWKGFEDMMAFGWTSRIPRMVAAEVYGSLSSALDAGAQAPLAMERSHDTVATSIGAVQGTYQSLDVLRRSNGAAVKVGDDGMLQWQARLASTEGLFVEPSSAAAFAAVEQMRDRGQIGAADKVAVLLTATGLKDPAAVRAVPAEPPMVGSNLDDALQALRTHYGFSH